MGRLPESDDRRVNEIQLKPWKFDGPRSSAWRLSMAAAKGIVLFVAVVSAIYFVSNPEAFTDLLHLRVPSSISRFFTSPVPLPEEVIAKESEKVRERVADTLKPAKNARRGQGKTAYLSPGISAEDVLRIEGQPDRMEADVWYYGASRVYFIAGRVANWNSSSERPLKVKAD